MTMTSGLVSLNNWVDWPGSSIAASVSASGSSPISNLVTSSPEDSCRLLSNTGYLRVDLGAIRSLSLFSIRGNPLLSFLKDSDTVRWRADTSTAGGYGALDTGYIAHGVEGFTYKGVWKSYGYSTYVASTPVSARYLEFSWNAPSLTAGVFDIGRLWTGDLTDLGSGFNFGESSSRDDFGVNERSPKTGRRVANRGGRPRRIAVTYSKLGANPATGADSSRKWADDLAFAAGTTDQIAFLRYSNSSTLGRETIIGHLEQATRNDRTSFITASSALTLVEDL